MRPDSTSRPYGYSAELYQAAGLGSPLPLPPRRKKWPPNSVTGRTGVVPSPEQVEDWRLRRSRSNICLRLAPSVIGIDVDAYDGKAGDRTIARLEELLGPLPGTFTSTSRGDGRSGIYFYRVPPGRYWPSQLSVSQEDGTETADVEIIQTHHRYAVCWPSLHPEGRQYWWYDKDGNRLGEPPSADDLPDLPDAWLEHLEREERHDTASGVFDPSELWQGDLRALAERSADQPCSKLADQEKAVAKILVNDEGRPKLLGAVLQLVRLTEQGHRGLNAALAELGQDYAERKAARRGGHAQAFEDWCRLVRGAVAQVSMARTNLDPHACCSCLLAELCTAVKNPRLFSRGQAGVTERAIMGYLLDKVRWKKSLLVAESQRQIAEGLHTYQPVVNRGLKRLQARGWLLRDGGTKRWLPAALVVRLPFVDEVISTPSGEAAGTGVDITLSIHHGQLHLHRLFGPQGLRRGVRETFLALAGGRTVEEMVAATGKDRRTVRRHLERLQEAGLASLEVVGGQVRWFPADADLDEVAERLGIPDSTEQKQRRHQAERRRFQEWHARYGHGLVRQEVDGKVRFIDRETEVLLSSQEAK